MSFSGVRIRTRSRLLPSMAASSSSTSSSCSSATALVMVMMILLFSQMCVRCHCSRAALAAASWPSSSPVTTARPPPSIIHPEARERLLQKYFRGGAGARGEYKFAGGGDRVFEETKRKIPSCPDPLHN